MEKNLKKLVSGSIERKALIFLSLIFITVIASSWGAAMRLKQTISAKNSIENVDVRALIDIERLRFIGESKIANSRAYFLLGSKALYEEQKKQQQVFKESLAAFEKQYGLPQVPEIIKRIDALEVQLQEIFDQATKFRDEQTESKIVAQFYQSKSVPIRTALNSALDEIVKIHNSELEKARARVQESALNAESQIPQGMLWFTGLTVALFLGLVLLVLRMLNERARHHAERNRLYEEAIKATQARDEVMVAISQDLKNPLSSIQETADNLAANTENAGESAELIKSTVVVAENSIKNILDQAKTGMGSMTLRFDQVGINDILSESKLLLQPLAKQHDIKLQIDVANPPVLAFFDRERVLRVLSNLVGNAIKFSPKHSKVAVRVRSDQQFVYVSVNDSGPGIPEKQLPEIFENFWQARKTADQGPGIGLAIVKTIVEAHGGTIRVESGVGSGSTFTFTLPRRRPTGAVLSKPASFVKHTTRTRVQESQQ